jgi:hypothetical protein
MFDFGIFLIPAWLVSALAMLAALSIGLLKYMPRLIRLALIFPTVYFAAAYFYASLTPAGTLQVAIVRFGLIGLFLAEIVTALPYLYKLHRAQIKKRLKALRRLWQSRRRHNEQ